MESDKGPGTWTRLVQARADERCTDDIEKDLHRNFPTHELFGGEYEKIGRAELYKVLKAYSVHNPSDGYCQAQVRNIKLIKSSQRVENKHINISYLLIHFG